MFVRLILAMLVVLTEMMTSDTAQAFLAFVKVAFHSTYLRPHTAQTPLLRGVGTTLASMEPQLPLPLYPELLP